MSFVTRLLTRPEPAFSEARPRDAAAIAAIHAASFPRGWGEDEFQRLLARPRRPHPSRHRRPPLVGFVMSRMAAGEAEILSVAIAPAWRGRGFARPLLDLHLRRLAGLGTRALFLEVDEHNAPARRLYDRAGFFEVGRRAGLLWQRRDGAGAAPRPWLTQTGASKQAMITANSADQQSANRTRHERKSDRNDRFSQTLRQIVRLPDERLRFAAYGGHLGAGGLRRDCDAPRTPISSSSTPATSARRRRRRSIPSSAACAV